LIGYVESNFVLELALVQEGALDARQLLEAAQEGEIELAIPVFALCEPYSTVTNRARLQRRSWQPIEDQLRDLQRNAENQDLVEGLRAHLARLLELGRGEMNSLEQVIRELLICAAVLPLTPEVHEASSRYQNEHDLAPADAIIYATVIRDAAARDAATEKFFVTRNSKDFDAPAIREQLREHRCELLFEFTSARAHISASEPRAFRSPPYT
jgi:predicted nucleic acid-binding protein